MIVNPDNFQAIIVNRKKMSDEYFLNIGEAEVH